MNKEILLKTGLTAVQAEIYDFLLENGENKASDIGKKIKRPRGVAYKGLEELLSLGLIEKLETKKITRFRAEHPSKLEHLMNEREKSVQQDKKSLISTLPSFIASYNIAHNKPGVRYYEGSDGVTEILEHIAKNFQQNTEILSFVKILPPEFEKGLDNAVSTFIKKRINKNVKTRVISIDSHEGRELQKNDVQSLRETRLTETKNLPLDFAGGEIFIYENEICAVMLEKNTYFAFSIQNKSVAQLLRAFFEAEWNLLAQ